MFSLPFFTGKKAANNARGAKAPAGSSAWQLTVDRHLRIPCPALADAAKISGMQILQLIRR